jgi:sarcosine oxidase subunit gamma
MLESRFAAARTRPLTSETSAQGLPGGLTVKALAPTARFSLRLRATPDSSESVGDFRLDQPINRCVAIGDKWSARLGPDEWLIGGAEPDADLIQHEVETALDNVAHALVDVSHRNVAFEIAGPRAAAALNAGCPLDLDDSAFPPGAATRTLLGKADVVIVRPAQAIIYRVECWRSFATYVHSFLVEAVHGLGA